MLHPTRLHLRVLLVGGARCSRSPINLSHGSCTRAATSPTGRWRRRRAQHLPRVVASSDLSSILGSGMRMRECACSVDVPNGLGDRQSVGGPTSSPSSATYCSARARSRQAYLDRTDSGLRNIITSIFYSRMKFFVTELNAITQSTHTPLLCTGVHNLGRYLMTCSWAESVCCRVLVG
jgi:hypothetical protein